MEYPVSTRIVCLLGIMLLGLGSATTAQAWQAPTIDDADRLRAEQFSSVRTLAALRSEVPVIVRIEQLGIPLPELPKRAQEDRIEAIRDAGERLLADLGGRGALVNVKTFTFSPHVALTAGPALIDALERHPLVREIVEDRVVPPTLAQAVPLVQVNTNAWTGGFRGTGQTIAILDSGVDKSHPFFGNRVVSEACFSTTNAGQGSTSLCAGGVSSSTAAGSGLHCTLEGCDHGTHVAGIAAGRDPGGTGLNGMAPDASIIAMQIFSRFDNPSACGRSATCILTFSSDQLSALDRVFALRNSFSIASVNMSLGGGENFTTCDSEPLKTSIDNLRAAGIAVIIASGNDGFKNAIGAPACISSAISVGSTCDSSNSQCAGVDAIAAYSNTASFVSLVAPGSVITSSLPGGLYGDKHGTSMATPAVAGAWAVKKQQNPGATVSAILDDFRNSAIVVNDTRTGATVQGLRRIRFATASAPPPNCAYTLSPTSQSIGASTGEGSLGVTTTANCSWTAVSNQSWITTNSTGTGSGLVQYSVAANPSSTARTGTITVAGQTFTVIQAGLAQVATLLANGGFESGTSPWVQSSGNAAPIVTADPSIARTGSGVAWLGGYNSGTDVLYQDITIPADTSAVLLQFWYRIVTQETSPETAYDEFVVGLLSPAIPPAFPAVLLGALSNLDATAGWVQTPPIDVTAFRGQTVRLTFAASMDVSLLTSFFVDDITVTQAGAQPDTTPNAFSFASQEAVPMASVRTSNTLTPTGYDAPAPIGVSGGEYSIGCSTTFTASAGTISPGQSVCVRHTSASSFGTTVTSMLTIGSVSGIFSSTTVGDTSFAANVNAVVTSYYESILGRAPDASGLQFWSGEATRVVGLGADVREVFFAMSMAFFASSEYAGKNTTDTQFITDLYRTFFNRAPDASGLAYWQVELAASGSRSALLNSFLFSAEFSNRMTALFGTTSVRPETTLAIDLFRGAFGRLPDSAGFNYWLGRIRAAQCQGAAAVTAEVNNIAGLFFNSGEYLARARNDRDFVGDVYNAYLRRGPGGDSAGFNFWVGQISTLGRGGIRSQFVPSVEFQNRVIAIVNAGCLQ